VNYEPQGVPLGDETKALREYLQRELRRIASAVRDDSPAVWYRTGPVVASLSAGVSANWKIPAGNVILLSTSNTITLTGFAERTPLRERAFINIGTGVVFFKSEASESSASNRLVVPTNWNISAGGAAVLWRDPFSARHRGLSRT
jgi:hypothetical protein